MLSAAAESLLPLFILNVLRLGAGEGFHSLGKCLLGTSAESVGVFAPTPPHWRVRPEEMHRIPHRIPSISASCTDFLIRIALHFLRGFTFHVRCPNTLEQYAGGFVVGVLRHPLAAEGFGENRERQLVDTGAGGVVAGFDVVGVDERFLDATDDCGLF